MRNRWEWAAFGLLLCAGLCFLIASRDPQPSYKGRTLRQRVERCGDPYTKEQATDAIIGLVTDQGSALVRLLDYDPQPGRDKLISRLQRLPAFMYRTPFVYRWMFREDKRELRSVAALSAFEIAGAHEAWKQKIVGTSSTFTRQSFFLFGPRMHRQKPLTKACQSMAPSRRDAICRGSNHMQALEYCSTGSPLMK